MGIFDHYIFFFHHDLGTTLWLQHLGFKSTWKQRNTENVATLPPETVISHTGPDKKHLICSLGFWGWFFVALETLKLKWISNSNHQVDSDHAQIFQCCYCFCGGSICIKFVFFEGDDYNIMALNIFTQITTFEDLPPWGQCLGLNGKMRWKTSDLNLSCPWSQERYIVFVYRYDDSDYIISV